MKTYRLNRVIWSLVAQTIILSCGSAYADIEWLARDINVSVSKDVSQYKAAFKFINKNARVVKIRAAHSSCGCTISKVENDEVPPGGEGVIEAIFVFGNRQGKHTKKIIVETDDKDVPVSQLTLTVEIPTIFYSNPSKVVWQIGSDSKSILLKIKVDQTVGLKFQGIKMTDSMFTAEIRSLNKDGMDLVVSAGESSQTKAGSLVVNFVDRNGLMRYFTIPLLISDSGLKTHAAEDLIGDQS